MPVGPAAYQPHASTEGSYDTEKGAGGGMGGKVITIFGKKYTKKTIIITSIVLALILIIIIGVGAGLGVKGAKGKKGKSKGTGGKGGFSLDDTQSSDDTTIDWTSTDTTGTDDSSTTTDNGDCNSCECYTDFALLQQCVNNQHDMTMDILNNW